MNGIASNHLDRLRRKAIRKKEKADNLKKNLVDAFYQEFSAKDIDTMLNVVEQFGQTFEQEAARNIHAKIRKAEKLEFDDANTCLLFFESNYKNFLGPEDEQEED